MMSYEYSEKKCPIEYQRNDIQTNMIIKTTALFLPSCCLIPSVTIFDKNRLYVLIVWIFYF